MKKKREPRYKRLHRALYKRPLTSMGIVAAIGTVTPSKCISELRAHGVMVYSRQTRDKINVYWTVAPPGIWA